MGESSGDRTWPKGTKWVPGRRWKKRNQKVRKDGRDFRKAGKRATDKKYLGGREKGPQNNCKAHQRPQDYKRGVRKGSGRENGKEWVQLPNFGKEGELKKCRKKNDISGEHLESKHRENKCD